MLLFQLYVNVKSDNFSQYVKQLISTLTSTSVLSQMGVSLWESWLRSKQ